MSITQAALQYIPNKKYTVRNFFHTFTPTATSLHKDLKTIGNLIKQTQNSFNNHTNLYSNTEATISELNIKYNFEIAYLLLLLLYFLAGLPTPNLTRKHFSMHAILKIQNI